MYLLDTNVVSEVRRNSPQALRWIRSVDPFSVYLSVVTFGEITRGIVLKQTKDPVFSRRLSHWLQALQNEFSGRAIAIDDSVAIEWGRIGAGRSRGAADGLIAATALVHKLTLVTRNIADFQDLSLAIVDPWNPPSTESPMPAPGHGR